jgi:NADPH2:quinone reductase
MKAIRVHQFGGPEVLRLEEVPDPKPGRGEVLIDVKAAGVNPVETYIRTGAYAVKPSLPYTPGMDAAGVVAAVGEGVTRWKPGDRVYVSGCITGTYAERALCPESGLHPLPAHISFAQGAALAIPYATAYRGLYHKAKAQAGETILVHGASGAVGVAAVQMGRAAGMTVIGTAGSDKGRKLVLAEGARHALDHTSADYLQQVLTLTGGRGVDVILEMLANKNLGKDLTVLGMRGRVVIIGSRGPVEINPRDAMVRDATVLGFTLFNVPENDKASIHAAIVAGLENGTLRPIVGQELKLADAARAHVAVLEPGAYGKIVLVP